jgi:hypothetical protein
MVTREGSNWRTMVETRRSASRNRAFDRSVRSNGASKPIVTGGTDSQSLQNDPNSARELAATSSVSATNRTLTDVAFQQLRMYTYDPATQRYGKSEKKSHIALARSRTSINGYPNLQS